MEIPFWTQAGITRPANTTQYTVKDVVGEAVAKPFEFPHVTPKTGMGFWIYGSKLISSNTPTTLGSFILMLFNDRVTVPVDHAVFAPTKQDLGAFISAIRFDSGIMVSTGTFYVPSSFIPVYGVVRDVYQRIFGVLLDDNGYTPASGEQFQAVLTGAWECE